MHLQRVRVPDFRVLQDVDIEFEKEFFPKVFPLGSQNGGGKSTLLQLIFVLLHCSQDPERIVFLENFLEGFKIPEGSSKRDLASFEIWDSEKTVLLEFFCCNDSYLAELVESSSEEDGLLDIGDRADRRFYASNDLEETKNNIARLEENINILYRAIKRIEEEQQKNILISATGLRNFIRKEMSNLKLKISDRDALEQKLNEKSSEAIKQQLENILAKFQLQIEEWIDKNNTIIADLRAKTSAFLQQQNSLYVCNYWRNNKASKDGALLCRIDGIDIAEAEIFLQGLSRQVYLATPVTQVFLFLPQESRKLLFRTQENKNDYYGRLEEAKSELSGLFAYDFLAVDVLINCFKAARDRDFSEAIETGGEYGKHYQHLANDLNLMLANKTISVDSDLSGVTFKIDRDDETVELYPEDLSHGELQRLSIYTWLKQHNIEDAIVLMDEIEIYFHPDWQYQIVADLQDWAPSNQYILATHSYELCEAVTPAHVKELEPKLLKSGAEK